MDAGSPAVSYAPGQAQSPLTAVWACTAIKRSMVALLIASSLYSRTDRRSKSLPSAASVPSVSSDRLEAEEPDEHCRQTQAARRPCDNSRRGAAPTFIRQAALTGIFFSACASAVLGNLMVSTPLAKVASILSALTPSGRGKERMKEP